MKAIRINTFGGPEVLKMEEVDKPVPAPDEILVEVYACGVNPVDWSIRKGGNDLLKPFLKLPLILGWDISGIIQELGSEVRGFEKGEAVFGIPNFPEGGGYAEFCSAKAIQFATKPKSIGFNEASAVPLTGLTAWTALFHYGNLKSGQKVLVQGASGGVGSFAVQFAKAKGAYVIGMASETNLEYLKEIGANEVIDYRNQKFEKLLKDVDLVIEASPTRDNSERQKAVSILKKGGIFVSVNVDFPFSKEVLKALEMKQAKGELAFNQARQDWLNQIAELIEAGKVNVFMQKVFPLEQVADAHRESETWHTRGKLVLEIKKEN